MKRRDLLLASAGLAFAGGASATARGDTVAWPDGVTLLDGGAWAPKPGHAQVIVRWATWCGFCRRHNAHVNALLRSLPADAPLQVLGVAADRDPEAVRRHVRAEGYTFPVTLDAAGFAALSPRRVIPLTITVDRQGRLREIIPGEMAEADVMALADLAR
ncbi:MAG: TlpA family protein disulfide reductase [Burkholderiaceae bacterium]|nr:TlpA family protein disulfide reductase [Burkholderiaceae bacterium]